MKDVAIETLQAGLSPSRLLDVQGREDPLIRLVETEAANKGPSDKAILY